MYEMSLPGESLDLGSDAGLDLGELLITPGVPQLIDDHECHDQHLQQQSEDSQRHVLNGNHLRRFVLEEAKEVSKLLVWVTHCPIGNVGL